MNVDSVYLTYDGRRTIVLIEMAGDWYEIINGSGSLISHFAEIGTWTPEQWALAGMTPAAKELNNPRCK